MGNLFKMVLCSVRMVAFGAAFMRLWMLESLQFTLVARDRAKIDPT
jgi:hypothetical protein